MQIPRPEEKISDHFTWKEALWLPELNRMADETDGVTEQILDNLKTLFHKLDKVREYFGKPITVHVCFRSMQYHLDLYKRINAKRVAQGLPEQHVPMASAHLFGMAVDFHIKDITCDDAKAKIMKDKMLEIWSMRMEDNGLNSTWVHLDIRATGPSGRYFKV
jgi:uncharacterized protein YcbK (DUF882 family)